MTARPLVSEARHGDVAVLCLNDPTSMNAASAAMVEALMIALDKAEADCRAIVITGAGRAFCSGANLNSDVDFSAPHYDAGALLATHYNPLMARLKSLPVPFLTAVNGPAAGGGAAIALAGDLVIASRAAFFLQPFVQIGLVPDSGSAFLLVHSAGRARAMEMMLLGERVAADTAYAWGMVNRVVDPDDLLSTALDLADRLAAGPTAVLGMIRALGWRAMETTHADMASLERDMQRTAGRGADHREGVAAFLEKRPAAFPRPDAKQAER
ncbi:enoyl-CoA hydratase/isomerase family protein [Sphingobium sp. 3R8]|uniref:enoyl-CoA hydratase-related protein n=1 Tax=Sphingobium sp. 3R8 TaxID=2874921 RepID=UPI001CCC9938|nr:enoyl-CoA hydratase-related protein [Sphingobium sp. 3R8]MBZ9646879.1 enoyl-CoA hydratase/isomerase family protein [Sphingobium sp. 3R8]